MAVITDRLYITVRHYLRYAWPHRVRRGNRSWEWRQIRWAVISCSTLTTEISGSKTRAECKSTLKMKKLSELHVRINTYITLIDKTNDK